jgi:PAS domain S-box-containing protein
MARSEDLLMPKNNLLPKVFLPLLLLLLLLAGSFSFLLIKFFPGNALRLIAAVTALSAAAAAAMFLVLRKYLTPLATLARSARQAVDDPSRRIGIATGDEIEDLARCYNRMADDLTRALVLKDHEDNIIKSMIDALIVVGRDSTIQSVNQATLDLLGYREAELTGRPFRLLFADADTLYIETWLDYLEREETISSIEETCLARDGRKIPVLLSGSAMRDKDGCIQGIVYVARDITQRKIAEELIRQGEERYRNLVAAVPDIIYSISVDDGIIRSLNPAFEKITGWACSEWIGRPVFDLIHPDDVPSGPSIFRRLAAGNALRNRELRLRTRKGSCVDCELTSAFQMENGKIVAELGIVRDITARKQAEKEREALSRELLQADKMAAVGQLAGGVAHEINNPLGVILGFAQHLQKQVQSGDPAWLPLQSIEREAQRCKALVRDLLTFSRTGRTEKEECDLNEVINSALSLVAAQARFNQVELAKEFAPDLPPVSLSRNQIQQVIVNLCNNAIDAMQANGRLTVRTRLAAAGRVALQVQDTGAGIAPEIQPRIFEPFFTTKEVGKGTGLGLSLVYEIIQQWHQGTIEFETEQGKGTIFKIELPVT